MDLLRIDTKVKLKLQGQQEGYISGYGISYSTTRIPYPIYLVDLVNGFYNSDKSIYVHTIVCSTDVVEEVLK